MAASSNSRKFRPSGNALRESRRTRSGGRVRARQLRLEPLEARQLLSGTRYSPDQIRQAYGIDSIVYGTAAKPIAGNGAGQTIAIIAEGDDKNIVADLKYFDRQLFPGSKVNLDTFGSYSGPVKNSTKPWFNQLTAPGSDPELFDKNSNTNGLTAKQEQGDAEETALDVEWAHAIAPMANIVLVDTDASDFFAAAKYAAALSGVSVVSMSYTFSELRSSGNDGTFTTPAGHNPVAFLSGAGDDGALANGNTTLYFGPNDQNEWAEYPASSPNVIAVGGTSLTLAPDGSYQNETGWSFPKPVTTLGPVFNSDLTWTPNPRGFNGSYYTTRGGSNGQAFWFTTITTDQLSTGSTAAVEISTNWVPGPGNATNATYSIFNQTTGTLVATVTVDQSKAASGVVDGNAVFHDLGSFRVQTNIGSDTVRGTDPFELGDTVLVVLDASSANGTVVADTVGIGRDQASGGGLSSLETIQPAFQNGIAPAGVGRTIPDVAFDADSATGVLIHDSYNPTNALNFVSDENIGGTSFGAPAWAGLIAIADQGLATAGKQPLSSAQALSALYKLPTYDFHDETSGYNGYSAGPGYDLITGLGSPIANQLIPALDNSVAAVKSQMIYQAPEGVDDNNIVVSLGSIGGVSAIEIQNNGVLVDSSPLATTTALKIFGADNTNNTVTIDPSGGNPIPSGGATFTGGAAIDGAHSNTIQVYEDADFGLANGQASTSLPTTFTLSDLQLLVSNSSGTMNIALASLQKAVLVGGAKNDTFNINNWNEGPVSLEGEAGADTYNVNYRSTGVSIIDTDQTINYSTPAADNEIFINDGTSIDQPGTVYTATAGSVIRKGTFRFNRGGRPTIANDNATIAYNDKIAKITINAGDNGNTLDVLATDVPLVYNAGTGTDLVVGGDATNEVGDGKNVTVNGSLKGSTSLTLDDEATQDIAFPALGRELVNSPIYRVTGSDVSYSNAIHAVNLSDGSSVPGNVSLLRDFGFSNLKSLTLAGSQSGNVFNLVPTNLPGRQLTTAITVNAGNGVTIPAPDGSQTIRDQITVGDPTANLDGFQSVTLVGGTGSSAILDDEANQNQQFEDGRGNDRLITSLVTYTLSTIGTTPSGTVTRSNAVNDIGARFSFTSTFSYRSLPNLTIRGGQTGNTYNVLTIIKGTAVNIDAGNGAIVPSPTGTTTTHDQVNVGNALNNLDRIDALTVNGGTGTTLSLDDEANRNQVDIRNPRVLLVTQPTFTFDVGSDGYGSVERDNKRSPTDRFSGAPVGPPTPVTGTVKYLNVASLSVQGGQSPDTFDVAGTLAGTPIAIQGGAGDDTATMGTSTNLLDGIQSTVSFDGQAGSNTLNIDDQGGTADETYIVSRNQVTRTPKIIGQPSGPPTQIVNFSNIANLHVHTDNGNGVEAVLLSVSLGTSVDYYGGSGQTIFELGNYSDLLNDIQGPVALHGGAIRNFIELTDQGNTVAQTFTLTAGKVQRTGIADISYDGLLSQLLLFVGNNPNGVHAADTVNVESTSANMATLALVGSEDTVNLGAPVGGATGKTLQGFNGSIVVDSAQTQSPTVFVDDSADPSTTSRIVTFDQKPDFAYYITGMSPQPIYLSVGSGSKVSVLASNADETFAVNALPSGVNISLNGEGGNDTLDYSNYPGNVTVNLAAGTATGFSSISNIENAVGIHSNSILVGNSHANAVTRSAVRNILIGADGAGQWPTDQKIRISGATNLAISPVALDELAAEWDRTDADFNTRVDDLMAGV